MDITARMCVAGQMILFVFVIGVVPNLSSSNANTIELLKPQFEAAFQGRCGRGSPCEQLCYELHDGMYECDCKEGYELHQDGYSCYELNTTMIPTLADADPSYGPETDDGEDQDEDILYQRGAQFSASLLPSNDTNMTVVELSNNIDNIDTKSNDKRKITESTYPSTTVSITEQPCLLSCGSGGVCGPDDSGTHRCYCPLGRGGDACQIENHIESPKFSGSGWLAFPPLRAAYKRVRLSLEIRPETYDGIFFLTGERDDMAGDFMALSLHQGFIEFRFDCGSGIGVVRSEETVLLNQWNRLILYRHRWDAWLQLNDGKRVKGRSKGLFSRITFREPLFIGGPGNTTGLADKLPVTHGLRGCVRHLRVNDHVYKFSQTPHGDASKGFDVQECTADHCSHVPCKHGGKCLTSDDSDESGEGGSGGGSGAGATCVCPLGFAGDLCEMRVDLQVPAFNGTSYLRYRGLSDAALSWLDLRIVFKPVALDGIILYNGNKPNGSGDFLAVYLNKGYVEFAFNLGTGAAITRSKNPVSLGEWHEVKVSRTGRLGWLELDGESAPEVLSPGAFTQLSLIQSLFIGGVPHFGIVSSAVRSRVSFVGCVQRIVVNSRPLGVVAEALGGANVNNCPHPCVARPCGEDGLCIPERDYFTCRCRPGYRDPRCSATAQAAPHFSGHDSYLHVTDPEIIRRLASPRVDVNIRFKADAPEGLLLATGHLFLELHSGGVVLRRSPGVGILVYNATQVDDGLWHRLRAVWTETGATLEVDSAPPVIATWSADSAPPTPSLGLYIGGTPSSASPGITGCVADLVLDSEFHVNMISMASVGKNVGRCNP